MSVLRAVRKRKKVRKLGQVKIIRREAYADLELEPTQTTRRSALAKRESRLMLAAGEIHDLTTLERDDVSYWPRGLVQCTLPFSNPGSSKRTRRTPRCARLRTALG